LIDFVLARLNDHSKSFRARIIRFRVSERQYNNFGVIAEASERTVTESTESSRFRPPLYDTPQSMPANIHIFRFRFSDESYLAKTRVLRLSISEDFVM